MLISKGVVPGPQLFQQHGTFVMTVFVGLLLINLMMLIVGLIGNRPFGLVARVPTRLLGPFVLVLIVVGSYAYDNYTTHVIMVLVLAAIAYWFERIGIPTVPIVLAFIMGPIIEENLSRALTITAGDLTAVLSRPITAVLLLLALATAIFSVYSMLRAASIGTRNQ